MKKNKAKPPTDKPTGVSMTEREREQIPEQRRLLAEVLAAEKLDRARIRQGKS